jgi:hypothetical protein
VVGLAQSVTQSPVECLAKTGRGCSARGRQRTYDDAAAGREVVEPGRHQVAQPAQHPISHHRGTHGPRHDEANAGWTYRPRELALRRTIEVHSKQPGPAAAASPDGRSELGALAQPGRCRQHVA